MGDYVSLSIDENALSNKSIDEKAALRNLQTLQKHIFQGELFPKSSGGMAAGRPLTLPSGTAIYYGRQESVNEEEMFGDGRVSQNENDTNIGLDDEARGNVCGGGLPDFSLLGLSGSSESEPELSGRDTAELCAGRREGSASEFRNVRKIEAGESDRGVEYADRQDVDLRQIEKRSLSDDQMKRQRFSSSSLGDVFDDEEEFQSGHYVRQSEQGSVEDIYRSHNVYVKKSNSLPDLVTSSSLSPESPSRVNRECLHQPGITEVDESKDLTKLYKFKQNLEGHTSYPEAKINEKKDRATPILKSKPKFKRTVSFKEESECKIIDPFEGNGTSGEIRDPDRRHSEKISTPTEQRRQTFRSSGYGTGSDAGSHEKSEVSTSRQSSQISQASSGVWTSEEIEEKESVNISRQNEGDKERHISDIENLTKSTLEDINVTAGKNISLTHGQDMGLSAGIPYLDEIYISQNHSFASVQSGECYLSSSSDFNDSGSKHTDSSKSSANTIIDAKTKQPVGKRNHGKGKLQEDLAHNSQSIGSLELTDANHQMNDMSRAMVENEEVLWEESKSPYDLSPGNLPKIIQDESFSLPKSSIEKVHEEDRKYHMVVKQIYCGVTDEGSLGCMPGGPPSVMPSCPGSLSQISPAMRQQWFEELLMKLNDDDSPRALEEIISQLFLSPDNHCPSPLDKDQETSGGGRKVTVHATFDLAELERASRCRYKGCKEPCCKKLQEINRVLRSDMNKLDCGYELVKCYCQALYQHCYYNECEDVRCPVQFCSDICNWELYNCKTKDDLIATMVSRVQKYMKEPTMQIMCGPDPKFFKLQSSIPRQHVSEFDTYLPLFPLGQWGSALVCMEKDSEKLIVIKTYLLMDCKHQLSLYARMKDLSHPNIVTQYWLLEYDEKIQVCSQFAQGGNLEDYLSVVGKLPWRRVLLYMRQVLSAIVFLHGKGVIYLYWCSGNMLFQDDRHRNIQVGNFSLACPKGYELDIGTVKECLPYNICPPELLSDHEVDFKSDCWGAGCLMYEMLTGTPMFHHCGHEERSKLHTKIQHGCLPDISRLTGVQKTILDSCWKKLIKERWDIGQMEQYIQSLK